MRGHAHAIAKVTHVLSWGCGQQGSRLRLESAPQYEGLSNAEASHPTAVDPSRFCIFPVSDSSLQNNARKHGSGKAMAGMHGMQGLLAHPRREAGMQPMPVATYGLRPLRPVHVCRRYSRSRKERGQYDFELPPQPQHSRSTTSPHQRSACILLKPARLARRLVSVDAVRRRSLTLHRHGETPATVRCLHGLQVACPWCLAKTAPSLTESSKCNLA